MERDYIADSERNVVLHVVELARRLLCRRSARRSASGLGGLHRFRTRLAAASARAEHLHRVGDDLGRVAVLPFLVLPFARAQASLDIDLRALLQIFAGYLGQAAEENDPMPFRFLGLLAA